MEHHLIYKDSKSDKFWNIKVKGKSFTVTYGKSGTKGASQTKKFDSEEKCQKEAEKLVNEKLKKGYKTVLMKKNQNIDNEKTIKATKTQDHKQQWQELVKAEDTAKAVYNHLLFLCETLECKKILKQICEFVESVKVKEDRLLIDFGGDSLFIGLPPYSGDYDKGVPESHRQVCNHHREITLEGSDAPIVFNGVNKKGELSSNAFDPYDFEDVEVIEEHSDSVISPIDYKQDYIIYHPALKTKHKEPALCYLSHEGDGLYAPYSNTLGIAGILLRLFAEDILNVELLEAQQSDEHHQEKKAVANLKPIPFKRSKKALFTLKRVSQHKNENGSKDPFNGMVINEHHIFCTTSHGVAYIFKIDKKSIITPVSEKKLGFPLSTPLLVPPYIYATTYKATAIIYAKEDNDPKLLVKIPLEWQFFHQDATLLVGNNYSNVAIFDIHNPLKPVLKSTIEKEAKYDGVRLRGSTLFLGTENELLVFDLSKPSDPKCICKLKSPISCSSRELRLFEDILVVNHQWFIDIKNPQKPVSIGFTKISLDMYSTVRINNHFIIFSEFGEYFVIDASDRNSLCIVQRAKLLDESGETVSYKTKFAEVVDNHLVIMTDSELACFEQVL